MRRGAIVEAIRKGNRNAVIAAGVVTALVIGVLLLNWKTSASTCTRPSTRSQAPMTSTCPE